MDKLKRSDVEASLAGPAASRAKIGSGMSAWLRSPAVIDHGPASATKAAPTLDALAKWKKHIGSARIVWSRLSYDELLKSEGQSGKLTGLVQERYAISPEAAGRKVKSFLQQYKLPLDA